MLAVSPLLRRSYSLDKPTRMRTAPVQRSSIGSTGTSCSTRQALISARGVSTRWLFVMLAVVIAPANLPAQTATTKSETAATADAANVVPLGQYVPKDNLFFYFEFAGLNAHDEAWKKTAACKMLYDTPLGGMLEEVSTQLLDKGLSSVPDMKMTGAEIVSLVKNTARSGFVMALHIDPKAKDVNDTLVGTFVLRGAASKSLRPISSRFMGRLMGPAAKPKIEFREGRAVVSVPHQSGSGGTSWAWWAEKSDLVLSTNFTKGVAATLAALDGKDRSAVDHPIVQELFKPEGSFHPVSICFFDVASCPEIPTGMTTFFRKLEQHGLHRLDARWGFDDDAIMTVTRLAAPKPRQPIFAIFDQQPTFEKTSLLPLPEGVESFVELSLNVALFYEIIAKSVPDAVKAQIDEFTGEIQESGKIDLQKDLFAHLGPKMVFYLAPGRSAATTNEESSLESLVSNGLNPMAAVAGLPSLFPKLTMVAEVKNPEAFGKALDALIIAINSELKAQAIEKATHEREAEGDQAGAGGAARAGGRNQGTRPGAGGDRTKRRALKDTPAPHFLVTPGKVNSYQLITPSESTLRLGPSGFRPTIHLEDKYLAFSLAADSARAAITAVKGQNWAPSANIQKATERVPSKLMLLMVSDVAESLPSLLANLPGTLQTTINTSIALSRNPASADQAGTNGPGGMAAGAGGQRGPGRGRFQAAGLGGRGGAGAVASEGGSRPPQGYPGAPGVSGNSTTGPSDAAMIQFKIDADKLPKADDLKTYLFASTLSVTVSDQDIRFVSRGAFPSLGSPASLVSTAFLVPALRAATAGQGQSAQVQAGAPTQPPAAGTPSASPGGRPQGRGGMLPGGPRGKRRGD